MATLVKRATGDDFMRELDSLIAAYRKRCRDLVEDCTPLEEGGEPVDGIRIKDVSAVGLRRGFIRMTGQPASAAHSLYHRSP